jgi:hypothetical protein
MDVLDVEIGWTGSRFGVLYNTSVPEECGCDAYGGGCSTCYTYPLWFRVVDAAGAPVGMETQLHPNAGAGTRPRVVWTGTELAVGRFEGDNAHVRTFDQEGTALGMVSIDLDHSEMDLDAEGGSWVFAWADQDVFIVSGTGGTAGPEQMVLMEDSLREMEKARIAGTGAGAVIAYVNRRMNVLEVIGIDAMGIARGMPQPLMPMIMPIVRTSPIVMAGGRGQAIVLVATPAGMFLARAAPDGSVIQPATMLSTMGSTTSREPRLDWDVATGALVWRDATNAIQAAVIGCPAAVGPAPMP